MRVKVSILTPVFNESRYVDEMISSVRSQSHRDWEMLVVDDGSTDDTVARVRRCAATDSRVCLLAYGQHIGKVAAFNLAYQHARGDVIVLLAGDDTLPPDSLATRVAALADVDPDYPAAAFFRLRTFSADPKYDGMVVPRKPRGNRSGGTLIINRPLANAVFPIAADLVAEDIWISRASVDQARSLVEGAQIVLNYRIHPANSNPRAQDFGRMTAAMHARNRAWKALLDESRLHLTPATRRELQALWAAEQLRVSGNVVRLLFRRGPKLRHRLAMAAMAQPLLFALRSRFYRAFSGRR